MRCSLALLVAYAAALSGTVRAQDVSTDVNACGRFCLNKAGTDNANALLKCNPVTAVDLAKCICDSKAITSAVLSCVKQVCPVFQDQLNKECDDLNDALSGGAGAKAHGGISLVVGTGAMVAGALLV